MENEAKNTVINNLRQIQRRIETTCLQCGRAPEEISLLLATKTVSAEKIKWATELGYRLVGENKLQEIQSKFPDLYRENLQWHMIGHLQTNKVKHVLKYVDVIQSVDRIRLAEKLQQRCEFLDRTVDIFIQVNTSFEESKFGVEPEKAFELIRQVSKLNHLNIKGLMTIGILSSKDERVRECFRHLKDIQKKVIESGLERVDVSQLSMGMSGDLEIAIEEGSTMIRVGTAIFGERPYPDSYYWNEKA